MSNTRNTFSLEVRARAVRMVLENEGDCRSRWAVITSISNKIGCAPQTLSSWLERKEVDSDLRAGIPSETVDMMKALEREVRELRQANEILRKASAYFAPFSAMLRIACQAKRRSSTARLNDDLDGLWFQSFMATN